MFRLHLQADATRLSGPRTPDAGQRIAPGLDELLRGPLGLPGSLPFRMEMAIAEIEDELAGVPRAWHGAELQGADQDLRDIARAAGLGEADTHLHRDAVERVFARQSAVALGRPATAQGLPEAPRFLAALLLVRELMHHLDIEAIALNR